MRRTDTKVPSTMILESSRFLWTVMIEHGLVHHGVYLVVFEGFVGWLSKVEARFARSSEVVWLFRQP